MTASKRPRFEVADVLRLFGSEYRAKRRLPIEHLKVMQHIVSCRTAALGGHMEECDSCGLERPVYNSCRNRHCPKCQTMAKEKWLEDRKADLLPVSYFHQVFTVPHELNLLILANKKVLLSILFKAVSETLLDFGKDPKQRLNGKVGFSLVLHTWNQRLLDHFHLHCVMPAGALKEDGTWVHAKHAEYLFPVKALAKAFRGKFIAFLRGAFEKDELIFPGVLADFAHPVRFECLLESLSQKSWHVYSKPPFGGPETVLNYLGRYTHRIAISNHRLVDVSEEGVSFTYRDSRDENKKKVDSITGEEFIRRFLLHTLPSGFVRIRHYGFLGSRKKKKNLEKCREALKATPPTPAPKPAATPEERLLKLTGIDVLACPSCRQGRMQKTKKIPKVQLQFFVSRLSPQLSEYYDTS